MTCQTGITRETFPETDPRLSADQEPVTGAILEVLAVAELAYPLAVLGLLGVVYWLASPGLLWPGVIGAALLAAGGVGLATVPAGAAATLLIGLGAASLVMEVLAFPGVGLHAAGGGVGLSLGGLFLHGPWSGVHPGIVLPIAIFAAAATYDAGCRSWRHIRSDPFASTPVLTGREAVVLQANGSRGQAVVAGALWRIRTTDGPLCAGQTVRVTHPEDGWLTVEPTRSPPSPGE